MFKKIFFAALAIALVASLASCSKYGDLKDAMDKMVKAADNFKAASDKAGDAKSAASAVDAYAAEIKALVGSSAALFEKYDDVLGNSGADLPAEVKTSYDKFVKIGSQLGVSFKKINESYSSEKAIQDAYTKHYEPMKSSITALADSCSKFSTDATAVKDGKAAGSLLTTFGTTFRKSQQTFNQLRPFYPELAYADHLPEALLTASHDLGTIEPSIIEGLQKIDAFASDEAVKKAYDERYKALKGGIDQMNKGNEVFLAALEKANDAKTVAAAIEAFANDMKPSNKLVAAEVKQLPELQMKMQTKTLPESLEATIKKMTELSEKLRESFAKVEKYKDDEQVKKAMAKLTGQV